MPSDALPFPVQEPRRGKILPCREGNGAHFTPTQPPPASDARPVGCPNGRGFNPLYSAGPAVPAPSRGGRRDGGAASAAADARAVRRRRARAHVAGASACSAAVRSRGRFPRAPAGAACAANLQRDRRGRLPSADAGRSTQCSSRHHLGGHDEFRDVREDEEDDGGVVEGFPAGSCSSTPPLHWRKRGGKQRSSCSRPRRKWKPEDCRVRFLGSFGEAFLDATAQKSAHHWKELVELRTLGRSFAPLGHLHHPPDPQSDP